MKAPPSGRPSAHVEPVELPETGKLQGIEVDVALVSIGDLELQEALDHRGRRFDMIRGQGQIVGGLDSQKVHLAEKSVDVLLGELLDGDAFFMRFLDRLVFDVGEVHPPLDPPALVFQIADQDVLEQEGPEIPDMGPLIDRRSAGEEGHDPIANGLKDFHLLSQ